MPTARDWLKGNPPTEGHKPDKDVGIEFLDGLDSLARAGLNEPYSTLAAAQAATPASDVTRIAVYQNGGIVIYKRDAAGLALTTADGATWEYAGGYVSALLTIDVPAGRDLQDEVDRVAAIDTRGSGAVLLRLADGFEITGPVVIRSRTRLIIQQFSDAAVPLASSFPEGADVIRVDYGASYKHGFVIDATNGLCRIALAVFGECEILPEAGAIGDPTNTPVGSGPNGTGLFVWKTARVWCDPFEGHIALIGATFKGFPRVNAWITHAAKASLVGSDLQDCGFTLAKGAGCAAVFASRGAVVQIDNSNISGAFRGVRNGGGVIHGNRLTGTGVRQIAWNFRGGRTMIQSGTFTGCGDPARTESMTGVTQANPAVVTASAHGLIVGDRVTITGVVGMTELNGNTYTVGSVTENTFQLAGLNSTGFDAYVSGGQAVKIQVPILDLSGDGAAIRGSGEIYTDASNFTGALSDLSSNAAPGGLISLNQVQFDDFHGRIAVVGAGAKTYSTNLAAGSGGLGSVATPNAANAANELIQVADGGEFNGLGVLAATASGMTRKLRVSNFGKMTLRNCTLNGAQTMFSIAGSVTFELTSITVDATTYFANGARLSDGSAFDTRAELADALALGWRLPNGSKVSAGTLDYAFDNTAGNPIADMPGVVPGGDNYYPDHFRHNAAPGTTDMQPAAQALANWLISLGQPWVMDFKPNTYLFADTLDLSASSEYYELRGSREGTTIQATAFGPTKSLIRHKANSYKMDGFRIRGTGSKNDPVGMDMGLMGRAVIGNMLFTSLGNTSMRATRATNADWVGPIDIFFSGWQPLHKDVTMADVQLSTTAESTTITATSAVFSAADVGVDIAIMDDLNGNLMSNRIATYISPTQVTLERPSQKTATGVFFSFCAITATATGNTLVFPRDIDLGASDVGRHIYVDQAGTDGTTLTTKIASVTSGSQCVLEDTVSANGTYRIYFTPAVYIGPEAGASNDISINHLLIEGYSGPGLIVDGGIHVKIQELKTHGRTWAEFSNWGRSAEFAIFNGTGRSFIELWQAEKGFAPVGGAPIRVAGDSPGLSILAMHMTASVPGNGFLFEFTPTDVTRSSLGIPVIEHRNNLKRFDGIVKATAPAARRVYANGRIGGESVFDEASRQVSAMVGSVRSFPPVGLGVAQIFRFTPSTPAGLLMVACDTGTSLTGVFAYRVNGAGVTMLAGGGSAGTTLGESGKLNIGVDTLTGEILIENLSATSRRYYVSISG